ncbi:MAG: tetratricopeptide repeat protein [Anaerolineae bacterium]
MHTIAITCLGEFEVVVAGHTAAHLPTDKARALLVYLALEWDRPHSRQVLTGLLWPDQPQERAFANLRTTLRRLRRTLDETAPAITDHALIATRQALQVRPDAFSVDVHSIDSLMAACAAHGHADLMACDACLARLAQVVALYRGDLLAGFSLPNAAPFEEWLVIRREMTQQQALAALHVLAEANMRQGQYDQVLAHATRQLVLDPYREHAYRQTMRALASLGQRAAALAHYERWAEALRNEVGAEPERETTDVAEEIRTGRFRPTPAPTAPPALPDALPTAVTTVPAYVSSFVGREQALSELIALLEQPDMRLLSIVGAGGMGKTRLAAEVARLRQDRYPDGVVFVPLAPVTEPSAIVSALAAALGLTGRGVDPRLIVTQALRHRHALIVLDNFEHLLEGTDSLVELLEAAPAIQVIVTSRERLNVRGEHVYPVQGMEYDLSVTLTKAASLPAVRLFVQSARRIRAAFELNAMTLAPLLRICHLVQGMPLGLELAAAWVEALSVEEIATEIEANADFLANDWRDAPARQRSMRAVFDWSWRLLSDAEQAALRQLSVFRGGFTRDAARVVAGASLRILTDLTRKSLLQRSERGAAVGRYEMHELVRQFAAEQNVAAGDAEAVAARHAAYYAAFLKDQETSLTTSGQSVALNAIGVEIDNVRAAWRWLVAHRQVEGIAQALEAYSLFCELRSWRQEGEDALRDAYARLAPRPGAALSDATRLTLSRLLAWRGRFSQFLGRYQQSDELLAESLALADGLDDGRVTAFCRASQGINAAIRGDYMESSRLEQEAIRLYGEVGDVSGIAEVLNRLGGTYYDMGRFLEAKRCWEESHALFRSVGDRSGMARDLNNLGEVARHVGDYAASRQQAEESLALLREIGHGWQALHPLNNLGMLARISGQHAEARRLHEECLAIARDIGDQRNIATALLRLAAVSMDVGEWQEARELHAASLSHYREIGHLRGIAACLTSMGQLALRCGANAVAPRLFEASLEIAQVIGDRLAVGKALSGLGWSRGALGDEALAGRAIGLAFETFTEIQAVPDALQALVMTAALLTRTPGDAARLGATSDRVQPALDVLDLVQRHPAAWHSTRAWAARVQAELGAYLPAELTPTPPTGQRETGDVELKRLGRAALEAWSVSAGPSQSARDNPLSQEDAR